MIWENWQHPYFLEFDHPVDKELFDLIVIALEGDGCTLLASICDQGGSNEGLRGKLGNAADET